MNYYGLYRARVVEVDIKENDYQDYGAIKIAIPDYMIDQIDSDINLYKDGLIAYPANNPIGGRNSQDKEGTSHYQGSVYVPAKNSYVWVFFEGGNLDQPRYLSAWDCRASKLPPENRDVEEPHKVYTILKTHSGRAIVVSDSKDVERVEITGKKRKLQGDDPAGNTESVYEIDDNQTTILFDERQGKEKILIRTHKGDFIHIDIDERKLQMSFENDINIKTNGNLSIDVAKDLHIKTGGNQYIHAKGGQNIKSEQVGCITCDKEINMNSSGVIRIDGVKTFIQSGIRRRAASSNPEEPKGERDT